MSKLKVLIAAVVVLPLVAFGSASTGADSASGETTFAGETQGTQGYQCCWIYFMGHWYCIP
jgi:hypothetical protein